MTLFLSVSQSCHSLFQRRQALTFTSCSAMSRAARRVKLVWPKTRKFARQLFALERVPEHKKQEGRKGDCTGQGQNPGKTYAPQSSHLHARAVCGHGARNARGKHMGCREWETEIVRSRDCPHRDNLGCPSLAIGQMLASPLANRDDNAF